MQHYGLPTRLLDITSNSLVALYFATTGNKYDDAYVDLYSNRYNQVKLLEELGENLKHLESIFRRTKVKRSPFSDQVTIEASLAMLDLKTKNDFLKNLNEFLEQIDSSWIEAYQKIVENSDEISGIRAFYSEYSKFNNTMAAQKLYHKIRQDINDFDKIINPVEFYLPKIVEPRILNERIRNQHGLFILLPFIFAESAEDLVKKTQARLDLLRLTGPSSLFSDCLQNNDEPIEIKIPHEFKSKIIDELITIGIDKNFIYPEPSSLAKDIVDKYQK